MCQASGVPNAKSFANHKENPPCADAAISAFALQQFEITIL
jgi:hypothetical protein